MKAKNTTMLQPVIKTIATIVVMVMSVILCFAYMFYQTGKNEYESRLIIDVLGKQRMLSQMIAKDANRLYTLIQALDDVKSAETGKAAGDKIRSVGEDLSSAARDFRKTLENMHSGYLEKDGQRITLKVSADKFRLQMQEIDAIWAEFETSVNFLVHSDQIDKNVVNAVTYIDSNNERLLNACDSIIKTILEDEKKADKISRNISIILLLLSLVIIVISLHNLYKYIIGPFNELFKGISRIGLSNRMNMAAMPTKKELIPVVSEIDGMFKKIEKLISLIENMNSNYSFNEFLKFIYEAFASFIPYSYIGIALVKKNEKMIEASYGISDGSIRGLPEKLLGKKVSIRDTSLGRIIESGNTRIINDLEKYTQGKQLKDYNKYILEAGIRSSITLPLMVNMEPVGIIFFSSRYKNVYTNEHVKFLETLVNSIAISFNKNVFADELLYSSLLALVKLAEARDEDTGDHLDRMKVYSRLIACFLFEESKYSSSITHEYIENIERFSPMHDIGKVGIKDGILLKPGRLTEEEFEQMKKHTRYGADVLRTAESNITGYGRKIFQMGIEIAEGHHEKWDGSGYPYGKKGEDIPLSARIVAVADVFDALTSVRPYKEAFTFEDSFDIILQGSGKHFDPEIVRAFEANKKPIYEIYMKFHKKRFTA